jgi:uncharacterized protein
MDRKTYQFPLQLKSIEENGFFAGYASVFNVEDNHNDIILSGAFGNSLSKKHYGKDIKLLWQHKTEEPIGVFTKIVEDDLGLYVEGRLLLDVQRASEAYALLKSGAVKGLSIGFIVKQYDRNDDGARIIHEADLWEISLVTFPANEQAQVTSLKSYGPDEGEYARLESSIENAINILTTKGN